MGRLFSLGVVGNWPRKGVMPMKWLGVRPDTSKPPTRRITGSDSSATYPDTSKPPTRRITSFIHVLFGCLTSKPPTRRITSSTCMNLPSGTSKPPTRRITSKCRVFVTAKQERLPAFRPKPWTYRAHPASRRCKYSKKPQSKRVLTLAKGHKKSHTVGWRCPPV